VSRALTAEQVLSLLAAAPERVAEATRYLSPRQLIRRPSPDEWSASEVLAHLRACADVRGGYIERIIAEDRPTLRAMDPRTWMARTDYRELDFGRSLRAFADQRVELLAALRKLPYGGWTRTARVVGAGKALERTVLDYADWIAVHERPHLKRMARIAGAMQDR
jgi:hypothetical protein